MSDSSPVVCPKEAAHTLGLSLSTIYNHMREGKIPHIRIGNAYRIKRKDLDRILAGELRV